MNGAPVEADRSISPEKLLSWFLPACAAWVPGGFLMPGDGRKYFMPSRIRDEADRLDLIQQHLSGKIKPRPFTSRKYGERSRSDHLGYGAYLILPNGTAWGACLDVDVKGNGHALGGTEAIALAERDLICAILFGLGVPYFIERSGGGKGWHVWVIFETPQPAAFTHWLAVYVADELKRTHPEWPSVEAFPKQAKPRTLGSLVALPLPGRPKAPGGGRILWADGSERPLSTIVRCGADHLPPLFKLWEAEKETRRLERLAMPTREYTDYPGQKLSLALVLEKVAQEVIEDDDGEIIWCSCPRHSSSSGRSMKVNPDEDWWICHACVRDDGSGPAKPGEIRAKGRGAYTLARWLMPKDTPAEVIFRTLERIDRDLNMDADTTARANRLAALAFADIDVAPQAQNETATLSQQIGSSHDA